jgi:hypothetical protein
VNRLVLVLAPAALPATAQLTPTVTTLSSTWNPSPEAHSFRITAQLQYAPEAGTYPTGTVTFKFADTGNVLGGVDVRLHRRPCDSGVHCGVHAIVAASVSAAEDARHRRR